MLILIRAARRQQLWSQASRAFKRLDELAKEAAAVIRPGQRRRDGHVPKKHGAAPASREVLVSGKSWNGPKAGFGEQCLSCWIGFWEDWSAV